MPPDPPISFCTSRGSSYKHSVPMLCPSNGDFLATPLPIFIMKMLGRSLVAWVGLCFTIITDCTSLVVQSVVTKSVQGSKNMVQTQNTQIHKVSTLLFKVSNTQARRGNKSCINVRHSIACRPSAKYCFTVSNWGLPGSIKSSQILVWV